jgi:hypothetical protein
METEQWSINVIIMCKGLEVLGSCKPPEVLHLLLRVWIVDGKVFLYSTEMRII